MTKDENNDEDSKHQPEPSEEPKPVIKKKKVIVKKKKKKVDTTIPELPKRIELQDAKLNEDKKIEQPPATIEPREDVQLHGLGSIEKPVDLDKLLLSDQTSGILAKIKRKKKIKRKISKAAPRDLNDDLVQNGEMEIDTKPKQNDEDKKFNNTYDDRNKHSESATRTNTPSSKISKDVRLGKIQERGNRSNRRGSRSSSKMSNASVLDGGNMDVNSFIKNMKEIENEKKRYKRDFMSSSKNHSK